MGSDPSRVASHRVRDAWIVTATALAVRLVFVAWAGTRFPPVEDGHYYDLLARRLAAGAGYTWLWPDGAVTYAAHYPIGYPALIAIAYAAFGASSGVAMVVNALLGAAGAYAAYRLADVDQAGGWRPAAAGLAVALHPALVPYTAAVMTEGVTAAAWMIAAAWCAVARERSGSRRCIVAVGLVLGISTLVRPQSLILAPVFGALAVGSRAAPKPRLLAAAAVTAIALACVAPWTARNCVRMHRCALVSVNGGWNLLIGAQTETGGWAPVVVPSECATVWDEAGKDRCFERAATASIRANPGAWLARIPAKVAVTLDYVGAAPWYLHASNAAAFGEQSKETLGALETIFSRALLLVALVGAARFPGKRSLARKLVALFGAAGALTLHAWVGYAALVGIAALLGRRALAAAPVAMSSTAAVIVATAMVHATFFGAGRYGLVALPFVAVLAFAVFPRRGTSPGFHDESRTRATTSAGRRLTPTTTEGMV